MITASYETLLCQANYTAEVYMREAQANIDKLFGEGYASKHPELVGVFMQVAASDYNNAVMIKCRQELGV